MGNGKLLEDNVASIFKKAEFKVIKNKYKCGYEIDVLAQKDGRNIICECKQYEIANLEIRNLIHQWDSKNKELQADKIVLVIYGQSITMEQFSLAKKYGIIIWDYNRIEYYLNMDIEKLSKELLLDLGLKKRNLFLRFINLITPVRYRKF